MTAIARATLDILFAGIWQGACITIVASSLVPLAGRRLSAATRCAVYQLALLAIVIVPTAATLPHLFGGVARSGGFGAGSHASASAADRTSATAWPIHAIAVVLDDRIVLALAALWAIGVTVFVARLVAGSLQLSRLLRRSIRFEDRDGVPLYESHDNRHPARMRIS